MEIIRKTINLDEHRSHRVGILDSIPYGTMDSIEGNGNYGNFVKDVKINETTIKYLDILRNYNIIQEQLRNGIFLKRGKNERYYVLESFGEVNCGVREENDNFCKYDFKPYNINDFEEIESSYFQPLIECVDDNIVLIRNADIIKDIEKWWFDLTKSSGSFQFCKDFEKIAFKEIICEGGKDLGLIFNEIPTIDIPILLTNDTLCEELYYPYEYNVTGETSVDINIGGINFRSVLGDTIELCDNNIKNKNKFLDCSKDSIFVESKLRTLMVPNVMYINEKIHGILQTDENIYKYNNGVWTILNTDHIKNIKCGDGESIDANEEKYRTIPLKSCIEYFDVESGTFYFLVKYKNDEDNPLTIPYDSKNIINKNIYTELYGTNREITIYDRVIDIKRDDDIVTIDYVLSATEGDENNTGIHYREVLKYNAPRKEKVLFDNIYECDLWVEDIDYEASQILYYNEELKEERKINQAQIMGMEINVNIFSGSNKTMLFTKESANGLQQEPKYVVDMIFNRGSASAWENHFKLSECNTMEDLENYGNNYFNL